MVTALACKQPLALVRIGGALWEELAPCRSLPPCPSGGRRGTPVAQESKQSPASNAPSDATNVAHRESTVALSLSTDTGLHTRVLHVLRKYVHMWDALLGAIKSTEHRIHMKPDTAPTHEMPCRQGLAMRENTAQSVQEQLDFGVIEPATSE